MLREEREREEIERDWKREILIKRDIEKERYWKRERLKKRGWKTEKEREKWNKQIKLDRFIQKKHDKSGQKVNRLICRNFQNANLKTLKYLLSLGGMKNPL